MPSLPNKEANEMMLWLVIGTVVGIIMKARFFFKDFWHDEAFQYLYSKMPLEFVISPNDVHPPLFNLLTKGMLFFTDNIYVLRSVIVIMSIVFAFVFYDTIRQMFGTKTAVFSYVLLNLSPTFAYYSVEFRSYMFVLVLTILQIQMFQKMMQGKVWPSLAYIWLSALMLYTHFLTALVIGTQVLYLIFTGKYTKHILDYMIIFFISIPLLQYAGQVYDNIQSFWFKDIDIVSYISTFFYTTNLPQYTNQYIISIVILLFAIIGVIVAKVKARPQGVMYIIVPPTTMWIISQFFPFYHHRYFLFGGVFIFAFAGYMLALIQTKVPRLYKPILYIAILILLNPISVSAPLRSSAEQLHPQPNDIFVHTSTFSHSPYKVYFPEHKHLLLTNFSREILFTAGGSVVKDTEIFRPEDKEFILSGLDTYYFVSDIPVKGGVVKYDQEGLKVTKYS